jgi:hypothetical protein
VTLFAQRTALEFIVGHLILPALGAFVVFFSLGWLGKTIGTVVIPPVKSWWLKSDVRIRYRALSRGSLLFLVGLGGNLLVALLCLPLLRVPVGSGIKPMALPLLFVIIAGVTGSACRLLRDESRPPGFILLRLAAVVLCLMPLPTGVVLMNGFAAMRGLQFG